MRIVIETAKHYISINLPDTMAAGNLNARLQGNIRTASNFTLLGYDDMVAALTALDDPEIDALIAGASDGPHVSIPTIVSELESRAIRVDS